MNGKHGEEAAAMQLRMMGVERVHPIPTPIGLGDKVVVDGRPYYAIFHKQKVDGDIRGVMPGGTSVLAEVKTRSDRVLWSDLEKHQIEALDDHHALGGVSLLVFVCDYGHVHVMHWPIPGFGPGGSVLCRDADLYEWDGTA